MTQPHFVPRTTAEGDNPSVDTVLPLLDRLGWIVPLIVCIAVLTVAGITYWQLAPPLTQAQREMQQHQATRQVESDLRTLLMDGERILRTGARWAQGGLLNLDAPAPFVQQMLPLIDQFPQVNGVILARDDGQELFLNRRLGGWSTRQSNPDELGERRRYMEWKSDGTLAGENWHSLAYDPRQRPWYIGAVALPEGTPFWTEPYVFLSAQAPGITVALHWRDPASGRRMLFGIDILLQDIAHAIAQRNFMQHGQIALLTPAGTLLGLSQEPQSGGEAPRSRALLQHPGDLGLLELSYLLDQRPPLGANQPMASLTIPAPRTRDTTLWEGSLFSLPIGGRDFLVATLAPAADFELLRPPTVLLTLLLLLGTVLLAAITAIRVVQRVRDPIRTLFAHLESSRLGISRQMERRNFITRLALQLQQVQTASELANTYLSALAPRLALGQGLLCLWDNWEEMLIAISRYGGEGKDANAVLETDLHHDGLLTQCVTDQRPIRLQKPGRHYFRATSGLGQADPAEILILPIRHGEDLVAVLELATFKPVSDEEMALLAELEPLLALRLDSLLSRSAHPAARIGA